MNDVLRLTAVLVLTVLIPGCGWFDSQTDPIEPIRFGVINSLPDHPCYVKTGSESRNIPTISIKAQVTELVIGFLEGKGYEAILVANPSVLESGKTDMLIQIIPRKVFDTPDLWGYGFSDQALFPGAGLFPRSFSALQLTLKRKYSPRTIRTRPLERFYALPIKAMPDRWSELSGEDRVGCETNLQDNLARAVYLLLNRLAI